jgi:hypothetical protein
MCFAFVGTRRHEKNQFRNAKPKFTKSGIEPLKNKLYLKFDGNLKDGMSWNLVLQFNGHLQIPRQFSNPIHYKSTHDVFNLLQRQLQKCLNHKLDGALFITHRNKYDNT